MTSRRTGSGELSPSRKRRGAAAVEFAIIAPVFFMFIIGITEFGRAMMVQQTITNASRVGSRQAIVEDAVSADIQTSVLAYLTSNTVNGATVTVTPADLSTVGFGDNVVVTVSVPYDSVTWLPTSWFLAGQTLSASTTMLGERLQ